MDRKKIIDYKLVSAKNSICLDDEIGKLIKDGWQPFGSPFCQVEWGIVYQAVVMYEN